jgi:hypothetical protein
MKKLTLIAAASAALLAPMLAHADSDVNTATPGPTVAKANLDFTVVIPRVLFLQVGTGTALADNATVDMLTFTVPAANLGDGTDVVPTPGGNVTVRLFGNNGDIGLTTTTTGPMKNAAGDTIPWSEIKVTSAAAAVPAAGYLGAAIPHPAIPAAAGTSASSTITATAKVVRQEAVWTFAYDNTVAYAAGTYGSTVANNARLLYTATLP